MCVVNGLVIVFCVCSVYCVYVWFGDCVFSVCVLCLVIVWEHWHVLPGFFLPGFLCEKIAALLLFQSTFITVRKVQNRNLKCFIRPVWATSPNFVKNTIWLSTERYELYSRLVNVLQFWDQTINSKTWKRLAWALMFGHACYMVC